jgi:hypothetical protein
VAAISPSPNAQHGATLHRQLTAVGIFLFFGASMALLAGTTLLWRGTVLDRVWVLNAPAHQQLAPLGKAAGALFVALSAALAAAGIGWLDAAFGDGD